MRQMSAPPATPHTRALPPPQRSASSPSDHRLGYAGRRVRSTCQGYRRSCAWQLRVQEKRQVVSETRFVIETREKEEENNNKQEEKKNTNIPMHAGWQRAPRKRSSFIITCWFVCGIDTSALQRTVQTRGTPGGTCLECRQSQRGHSSGC